MLKPKVEKKTVTIIAMTSGNRFYGEFSHALV